MKEAETTTHDLILVVDRSSQTEVSFGLSLYEKFMVTNEELKSIFDKVQFSNNLMNFVKSKKQLTFIRDERLLEILNSKALSQPEELDGVKKLEKYNLLVTEMINSYAFETKRNHILIKENKKKSNTIELLEELCIKFKGKIVVLDEVLIE